MNILVLDYLGEKGHRKFNRIHFETLERLGHNIFYYGREGQFPGLLKEGNHVIIPERFYKRMPFSTLSSRIAMIMCLLWIKRHIRFKYDIIIVPTYDVFSVSTIHTKKPIIVINHNNIGQLHNIIKRTITRLMTSKMIHIVLNRDMEERLKEILPNTRIVFVPHGFYPVNSNSIPNFIGEKEDFLFCPINRNYNFQYVSDVLTSNDIIKFLSEHNLRLYVKEGLVRSIDSNRVFVISGKLSLAEYEYMILNAKAVILPYDEQFRFRCSGIFFECIAGDTPIIVTEIPAFKEYSNMNNIRFFSNKETFIECLRRTLSEQKEPYKKDVFMPEQYWSEFFNQLEKKNT